jgi:hypothetical protein
MIRYYDFSEGFPDKQDVYAIKKTKFEHDVKAIVSLEKKWIGVRVYGVNSLTKRFEYGLIKDRVHLNRQFQMLWSDGKETIQNAFNLFLARNRHS